MGRSIRRGGRRLRLITGGSRMLFRRGRVSFLPLSLRVPTFYRRGCCTWGLELTFVCNRVWCPRRGARGGVARKDTGQPAAAAIDSLKACLGYGLGADRLRVYAYLRLVIDCTTSTMPHDALSPAPGSCFPPDRLVALRPSTRWKPRRRKIKETKRKFQKREKSR